MKRLYLTAICLVVTAAALFAEHSVSVAAVTNTSRVTAGDSTPELRQKTFQKVWEIVRDKFFDPNFNGVDWNKVRERYSPLVAAVKSDDELYEVLNRMLGELHTSHMEIIAPEQMGKVAAPPVTTGLGLRSIEGRVVMRRVLPGSSAERAGLRPGFVVQRIDGADVKDLNDAIAKLAGPPNTKVRLGFLNENDESRELTIERVSLTSDQVDRGKMGSLSFYALLESKRLAGGVGYLSFTSFISALDKKISAAIESMHDAPGLIIDLRGNGGGDDDVAIKLASLLFDKPVQLMISRTRKGDSNYYRARPVANPYLGPVVILVDERSGSASEQLAAGLQETGRAYIVGKTTEGSDMDADAAKLPTGAYLLYAAGQPRTPKGVIIEGRGVIPNLDVSLTRAELLKGNDAQLSAALQYLKAKRAP